MSRAMKHVDAPAAAKLMEEGALMVDVREPYEFASTRVPGSRNVALSRLDSTPLPLEPDQAVVFFCASGNRTNVNAARLAAKAGKADAYVMQGGISAWGRAGLPVESGSEADNGSPGQRSGLFSRMFSR